MLKVGSAGVAADAGQLDRPILWKDNQSIIDIVRIEFPLHNGWNRKRFSDIFNVYDLWRLGGLGIRPTNNLLEHLTIQRYPGGEFTTKLYIFHNVTVLNELIRSAAVLKSRIVFYANERQKQGFWYGSTGTGANA